MANLPGGKSVELRYNEALGRETLMFGLFEKAELEWLRAHIEKGSTVLDIGGNIGLISVILADIVGAKGKVLVFEPVPENLRRLHCNLEKNALTQVTVYPVALGDREGSITLSCVDDGAFATAEEAVIHPQNGKLIPVPLATLDRIWHEAGSPVVSAIKLDVEGGELNVIKGAGEMLSTCRPHILIEANTAEQLSLINAALSEYGYLYIQPPGFSPWNYIFTMTADHAHAGA